MTLFTASEIILHEHLFGGPPMQTSSAPAFKHHNLPDARNKRLHVTIPILHWSLAT